jgi:branched-chain amino acid transport system permease protein
VHRRLGRREFTLTQSFIDIAFRGSIYALFAIGYALTYVAGGTFNVAHPVSAMAAAAAVSWLLARDQPIWVAAGGGVIAGAIAGVIVDRVVLWPARSRGGGPLGPARPLIAGLAALAAFGALAPETERPTHLLHAGYFHIGGFNMPKLTIEGTIASVVALLIVVAIVRATRYGLGLRALGSNTSAARAAGVGAEPMHIRTALLASMCGALAAIALLTAPDYFTGRSTPFDLPLAGLAAVALGGLSSLPASMIGAFIVASAQILAPTADASDAIAAALLVLAIALLPRGLLAATRLRETDRG